MQKTTKETREGLTVTVDVPTTYEEFDQLAKEQGACLRGGIADTLYRSVFPTFHYFMAAALCVEFKLTRPMVDNKDGKTYKEGDRKGQTIQVPEHSDPEFAKWVAARQGVAVPSFQPLANEVCGLVGPATNVYSTGFDLSDGEKLISFDPSKTERTIRSTEPGKDDLLTAQGLLGQPKKNLKISLEKISTVTGQVIELVGEGDPDYVAKNLRIVALAVKAYKKVVLEQAKNGLKV